MDQKPLLWPWIARTLDLRQPRLSLAVPRSAIQLPIPRRHEPFCMELADTLPESQISYAEDQRLLHSYGKSYPDLFFVRRGIVKRAPDAVLAGEGPGLFLHVGNR